MPQVLIAENDLDLQKDLAQYFSKKDISVSCCQSINRLEKLITEQKFHLLILDRILDDGDALEIINDIHDLSFQTQILLLTCKNDIKDRLQGLARGADDYLGKPFSLQELNYRVFNLLSKKKIELNKQIRTKHLLVEPETGLVKFDQETRKLRKREMEILEILLLHQNRVVSRNKIMKQLCFGECDYLADSTIDVYVRRIRMKLGRFSSLIKARRGFGYCLIDR